MKNSVIGMLSICFGILGFFSAYWYIGIIPCVVAVILGVVGLTDYLAYKWSSVLGLVFAAMGVGLFTYVVVTDMDDGKLIVAYDKGDFVYASNVDKGNEALSEFADILADAEIKAAEKALKHMDDDDGQEGAADDAVADEEWIRDRSVENTIIVDNTSADDEPAEPVETASDSDSYAKGKNYGTYWESEWLKMRYDQPSGFTILSDNDMNDLMRLNNLLLHGTEGAEAAQQDTEYEFLASNTSGDPVVYLGVDWSGYSAEQYADIFRQQIQSLGYDNSNIEWRGFEGTEEIGGTYFEKYTYVVKNTGSGLGQSYVTYYMKEKDDKLVVIELQYTDSTAGSVSTLMSGFSEL